MKKNNNYRIEIEYINGFLTSEFCNNYNCAVAFLEKIENENKNIKTVLYDPAGRVARLFNNL